MIKMGFINVKHVHGGGNAMEKYFEYYMSTKHKTQIVNPITGKVTILKQGK
jgi:hypothetical protein